MSNLLGCDEGNVSLVGSIDSCSIEGSSTDVSKTLSVKGCLEILKGEGIRQDIVVVEVCGSLIENGLVVGGNISEGACRLESIGR